MLRKMANRMDAIQARLAVVEGSVLCKLRDFREMMMGEFCEKMMTEFAKMMK